MAEVYIRMSMEMVRELFLNPIQPMFPPPRAVRFSSGHWMQMEGVPLM